MKKILWTKIYAQLIFYNFFLFFHSFTKHLWIANWYQMLPSLPDLSSKPFWANSRRCATDSTLMFTFSDIILNTWLRTVSVTSLLLSRMAGRDRVDGAMDERMARLTPAYGSCARWNRKAEKFLKISYLFINFFISLKQKLAKFIILKFLYRFHNVRNWNSVILTKSSIPVE